MTMSKLAHGKLTDLVSLSLGARPSTRCHRHGAQTRDIGLPNLVELGQCLLPEVTRARWYRNVGCYLTLFPVELTRV